MADNFLTSYRAAGLMFIHDRAFINNTLGKLHGYTVHQ